MAATSIPTTSRTDYVADNQDVAAVTEPLKKTEFYRIDKTNARTKNDGAWMHFPSVSLFSSVANAGVTDFFKQMGCEGSTNAYSIVGSTPLVDSLFSIKYALYEGKQDNPRLSLYAFSGDTYLYENPWAFAGKVLVRPGAQHTNSQQTNRNLCATRDAHMYTQPQLEIYADDVKCSHGATVGQLDENALFYMQQRGISLHEARLLLMFAFVNEVIDTIRLEALKDRLHLLVEKRFRGELNKCRGCAMCK